MHIRMEMITKKTYIPVMNLVSVTMTNAYHFSYNLFQVKPPFIEISNIHIIVTTIVT